MKNTDAAPTQAAPREPITDPNAIKVVIRGHALPADLANQARAILLTLALLSEARLVVEEDGQWRDVTLADISLNAVASTLASTNADVVRLGAWLARIADA